MLPSGIFLFLSPGACNQFAARSLAKAVAIIPKRQHQDKENPLILTVSMASEDGDKSIKKDDEDGDKPAEEYDEHGTIFSQLCKSRHDRDNSASVPSSSPDDNIDNVDNVDNVDSVFISPQGVD